MKNKYFISLLAICFVTIVSSWWIWFRNESINSPAASKRETNSNAATSQKEQMREAVQELKQAKKESDDKDEHNAIQKLAKAIGGKAGAMLGMADSTVGLVHFYGRVIDQYGAGVAGARVNVLIGGGGYMAPGSGLGYSLTDTEGYFEVNGKGHRVSIMDVVHPKIADVYYRDRDGKKKQGAHYNATNQYGENYNWSNYKTKKKPLEIHVWRVDEFENVKFGSGGFFPAPNVMPSMDKALLGIVTMCQRDVEVPNVHWKEQKGSWSITFHPIEGGIQQTEDFYLNEAPIDGYQSELTVSMVQGSQDYKVRIYPARHYYYYYVKNGKRIYGSLEATFEPFMHDDECRVNINYKYNPEGSRNLAVRKRD